MASSATTVSGGTNPTGGGDLAIKVEPGTKNVSVTPINMSDSQVANGQFSYSSQRVRISVPSQELQRVPPPSVTHSHLQDEDSNDAEVSSIDFSQHASQVNMRKKKKLPSSSSCMTPSGDAMMGDPSCPSPSRERERPMSWEGELSDSEMLVDTQMDRQGDAMHSPHHDTTSNGVESECGDGAGAVGAGGGGRQHLVREQDALNLKYSHQRSHSVNRVSVLSNDLIEARHPPSPLSQHKSLSDHYSHHQHQQSPVGLSSTGAPSVLSSVPNDNASLCAQSGGSSIASNVEQTIRNIPVNIIPQSLSNKMATDAHVYACKREIISGQTHLTDVKPELPLMVDKLLGGYSLHSTPSNSPLLNRHHKIVSNPSTDSALHSTSVYTHSVYSSPSASPGATRHAPYTPTLSRNNSDASHSSCYSYTSEFSPTHSPIQGRHPLPSHVLYRSEYGTLPRQQQQPQSQSVEGEGGSPDPEGQQPHQGVSRQQLINSPCPICGDKISGFHYGIFSCESCKGFFKRTVQNRKNYVCLRGANCPVTVTTRKKCPACRFEKCLNCGMKLEAIREDRTRGGRSTYQCSYTLGSAASTSSLSLANTPLQVGPLRHATSLTSVNGPSSHLSYRSHQDLHAISLGNMAQMKSDQPCGLNPDPMSIPALLQEIMDVEHLWQYNESELNRINRGQPPSGGGSVASPLSNPLLRSAGLPPDSSPDFLANLCNIADHRLYKIVKWCKSLPLFKNISIDDQICLLINSWCELLILSCCYRGINTPGEVRVSGGGKGITLQQSNKMGLGPCIERMLHFTDHLRRLRVDRYEYVAMKVIVLLTSDTPDLKEPEKVRASQEKALQVLQAYTLAHYPETPAKFGELLLRIPELQRTCQVGKEMLNPSNKSKDGEAPSFNLLMELLRGDH